MLRGAEDLIRELNATAGKLLPGVRIEPYYAANDGAASALWVYGIFPLNTSPERMAENARSVTQLLREFPEVERAVAQVGSSSDYDPQSSNQLQLFVGLKTGPDVPAAPDRDRPRSRAELLEAFYYPLTVKLPGAGWLTTTKGPEELGLVFPGVAAENLLKVFGPDLNELERLAGPVRRSLRDVPGIENVTAYRSLGQPHLEYRIDPAKCQKWGVTVADASVVLQSALGGKSLSQAIEGDKSFDITPRWPKRLRDSDTAILDLPVDIAKMKGAANDPIQSMAQIRLRDLVSPLGKDGQPDPKGEFIRTSAAAIYRENGKRLMPVCFSVRGRPLGEVRAEAAMKIAPLLTAPYCIEWSD